MKNRIFTWAASFLLIGIISAFPQMQEIRRAAGSGGGGGGGSSVGTGLQKGNGSGGFTNAATTGLILGTGAGASASDVETAVGGVYQATKSFRLYLGTLTHAGTVTLDFDGSQSANMIQLTGAVTFAFSNVATNRTYDLLIKGVSTNSNISWPSGVHGGPLTVSTADKWMRAALECFGTGNTNVFIATAEDP